MKGKAQQFKQQYDALYYGLHEHIVGDDRPWAQVEALRSSRTIWAEPAQSLPFISSRNLPNWPGSGQLERLRCRQFNSQVLDQGFVTCPMQFPGVGSALIDLSGRLQRGSPAGALWARWQEQIFNELPGLMANGCPSCSGAP